MASLENDACTNYPDFAVICSFIENFGDKLNVTLPNIGELQTLLEDSEDVNPLLAQTIAYLLRRIKRTIKQDKWEKCLQKFAHSYSYEDAWELEHSGFKKAKLETKIRVLKNLFEKQFDLHKSFKEKVNLLSAKQLRLQPCGRDKRGVSYWCQKDEFANLRIYKDDQDEETWALAANSREELVSLIEKLQAQIPQKMKRETSVEESQSETTTPMILSRAPTPLDSTFHTPEASSSSSPVPDTVSVSAVHENSTFSHVKDNVTLPPIAECVLTVKTETISSQVVESTAKPKALENVFAPSIKDPIVRASVTESTAALSILQNVSIPPAVTTEILPLVFKTVVEPTITKTSIPPPGANSIIVPTDVKAITDPVLKKGIVPSATKTVFAHSGAKTVCAPPIAKTVCAPPVAKPVEEPPVPKPVGTHPVVKPVDKPPVPKPVCAPPVAKPVGEPRITKPVDEPPAAKPIGTPPVLKSVGTPSVPKPVGAPSVSKTVGAPPVAKASTEPTRIETVILPPVAEPVAKAGIKPTVTKNIVALPASNTVVIPLAAKSVTAPLVAKTDVAIPASNTVVIPLVAKSVTAPLVAKTDVAPSLAKTVISTPVAEPVANADNKPAVTKYIVTPTVTKNIVTPTVTKNIITPTVKKNITPTSTKTVITPPVAKAVGAAPIIKTIVASPVSHTIAAPSVSHTVAAPSVYHTVAAPSVKKTVLETKAVAEITKTKITNPASLTKIATALPVIEPLVPKAAVSAIITATTPTVATDAILPSVIQSNISKTAVAASVPQPVGKLSVAEATVTFSTSTVAVSQITETIMHTSTKKVIESAAIEPIDLVTKTIIAPPLQRSAVTPAMPIAGVSSVTKAVITTENTLASPRVTKTAVYSPVIKPIVADPVTKPVVTPSVTRPVVAPSITRHVVAPSVTRPLVAPSVTKPVVAPSVTKPVVAPSVTKPVVAPSVAKPVVAPSITKPVVAPSVTKPVVAPSVTKPVVASSVAKPVVDSSVAKPVVVSSVAKPVVVSSIAKPVVAPSITKPVVAPSITKPMVDLSVTKPVVAPSVAKHLVASSVSKPVVASTVTKPVVASTVTKSVVTSSVTKPVVASSVTKPVVTSSVTKPVFGPSLTKPLLVTSITKTVVAPSVASCVVASSVTKVVAPLVTKRIESLIAPSVSQIAANLDIEAAVSSPLAKKVVELPPSQVSVISEVPKIISDSVQGRENYLQHGQNKPTKGDALPIEKVSSLNPSNEQKDYKSRVKEKESSSIDVQENVSNLIIDNKSIPQQMESPELISKMIVNTEKTDLDKTKMRPLLKDTVSQKSKLEKIIDKFAAKTASDAFKNVPATGNSSVIVHSTEKLLSQPVERIIPGITTSFPKNIHGPLKPSIVYSGKLDNEGSSKTADNLSYCDKKIPQSIGKVCTSKDSLSSSFEASSKGNVHIDVKPEQEISKQATNLVKIDVAQKMDAATSPEGISTVQQALKCTDKGDKSSLNDDNKKELGNLSKDLMPAINESSKSFPLIEKSVSQDHKSFHRSLHNVTQNTKDHILSPTLPTRNIKEFIPTDLSQKLIKSNIAVPVMEFSLIEEKNVKNVENMLPSKRSDSSNSSAIVNLPHPAEKSILKMVENVTQLAKNMEESTKAVYETEPNLHKVKDSLENNAILQSKDDKLEVKEKNLESVSVKINEMRDKEKNTENSQPSKVITQKKIDEKNDIVESKITYKKETKDILKKNLTEEKISENEQIKEKKEENQSKGTRMEPNPTVVKSENMKTLATDLTKITLPSSEVVAKSENISQLKQTTSKDVTELQKKPNSTTGSTCKIQEKIVRSPETIKQTPDKIKSELNIGSCKGSGGAVEGKITQGNILTKCDEQPKETAAVIQTVHDSTKAVSGNSQSKEINMKNIPSLQKDDDHKSINDNLQPSEMAHPKGLVKEADDLKAKLPAKQLPVLPDVKTATEIPPSKSMGKESTVDSHPSQKTTTCETTKFISPDKPSSNENKSPSEKSVNIIPSSPQCSKKSLSSVENSNGVSKLTEKASQPMAASTIIENKNDASGTGDTIQEPVMIVTGEGEGALCDAVNPAVHEGCSNWWENFEQTDEQPGREISESVQYFWGDGTGADCGAGNSGDEADAAIESKLATGTAGSDVDNSVGEESNKVNGVKIKEDTVPTNEDASPVVNNKGNTKRTRSLSRKSKIDPKEMDDSQSQGNALDDTANKERDTDKNLSMPRSSRSNANPMNSTVSKNEKCQSEDSGESDAEEKPCLRKGRGRGRPKKKRFSTRQVGKSYQEQESDEETEQIFSAVKARSKPPKEAPRQRSTRIAKIREREETERRELEALRMKQLSEENKLKDFEKNAREDRRSTREIRKDKKEKKKEKAKKKKKKKNIVKNGSTPWANGSSSSSSSSEEEELLDVEDEENEELVFKSDHEFSPESDIGEEDAQPIKRARTARKLKTEELPVKKEPTEKVEDGDSLDDTKCAKCAHQDHPETILLCDLCDAGWHLSCLLPPLLSVPEGDWTCPSCEHLALIEKLKEILDDYDSIKRRADNEEQRRQRLAYINVSLDNVLPDKRPTRDRDDDGDSESDSENDESGSDGSSSESSSSSIAASSDSGPLYTLRARPSRTSKEQVEDFDELIDEAIRDEMEAAMVIEKTAKPVSAPRVVASVGRGKDISNIMDGEEEEEEFEEEKESGSEYEPEEAPEPASADVESLIQTEAVKDTQEAKELEEDPSQKRKRSREDESDEESKDDESVLGTGSRGSMFALKKKRRLTDLDAIDDEDDSDEDFKGSSADESEEEDESVAFSSALNSDSDNSDVRSKRRGGRYGKKQPVRRSSRNRRNLPSDYDSEPEKMIRRAGVRKRRRNETTTEEDDFSSDSYSGHKPKRRSRPRQAAKSSRRVGRGKKKGGRKAASKKKKTPVEKGEAKPRVRYAKAKKVEETPEEMESKRRVTRGRQINFCDTLFISEEEEESDDNPPKSRGKVMKGERHQPDSSDYEEDSGDEMKKRRGVSSGLGKGKVMKGDDDEEEDDDSDYEPAPRDAPVSESAPTPIANPEEVESPPAPEPAAEIETEASPTLGKLTPDATPISIPVSSHAVESLIGSRPDSVAARPRVAVAVPPQPEPKSYPSPGYVAEQRGGRVGEQPQIRVASSPVPAPMIPGGAAVSITAVTYVPNPAAAAIHQRPGHIAAGSTMAPRPTGGSPKHNSDPHQGKVAAVAVLPAGRQSPGPKWAAHLPPNAGSAHSPRHGMATPPRSAPLPPNLNSSPPPPYRSSPIPPGYPHPYSAPPQEHYPPGGGHPGFHTGYHTPRHPMAHAVYGPPGSHPGYPHHGGVLRGPSQEMMRHRGSPNHCPPHPLTAMKSSYPGLEPMPYRGSPTPMDAGMRHGSPGGPPDDQHRDPGPKTSTEEKGEFSSGLMSYFSSQREDVD